MVVLSRIICLERTVQFFRSVVTLHGQNYGVRRQVESAQGKEFERAPSCCLAKAQVEPFAKVATLKQVVVKQPPSPEPGPIGRLALTQSGGRGRCGQAVRVMSWCCKEQVVCAPSLLPNAKHDPVRRAYHLGRVDV